MVNSQIPLPTGLPCVYVGFVAKQCNINTRQTSGQWNLRIYHAPNLNKHWVKIDCKFWKLTLNLAGPSQVPAAPSKFNLNTKLYKVSSKWCMTKLAATVEKSHRSRSKFNNKSARTQPSIITIGWHHCALSPSFLPSLLVTPVVSALSLAGNRPPQTPFWPMRRQCLRSSRWILSLIHIWRCRRRG